MKVTQIYLTEGQEKFLKETSKFNGISKSEMIRRILDRWIDKNETVRITVPEKIQVKK